MDNDQSLPDYIKPGLDILFIGINPGIRSATVGHHFAGHSNRFWKLLNEVTLVPHEVTYQDDAQLTKWGLGFTNMVSRTTKGSRNIGKPDYIVGREDLVAKVRRFQPRILAILGISLYPILFPNRRLSTQKSRVDSPRPSIGLLPESFEGARVVLLPNPSGRNAHYSYQQMVNGFYELKEVRRRLKESLPVT